MNKRVDQAALFTEALDGNSPAATDPQVRDRALVLARELILCGEWRLSLELAAAARKQSCSVIEATGCDLIRADALLGLGDALGAEVILTSLLAADLTITNDQRDWASVLMARVLLRRNQLEEAWNLSSTLRAASIRKAESSVLGWSAHLLGNICWSRGDWVEARRFLMEAITSARRIGDLRLEAVAAANLGNLRRQKCQWREASEELDHARQLWVRLGNYERVTHVLRSLGIIEWKRGRLERAKDLCQQAFRIATEAGDQQAKICADQLAALIILHAGDFSDAESQLKRTLSFSGEGAESRLLLLSREFIGDVELEQGRASSALNQYEEAFHDAFLRAPRGDVVAELRRRRAECFYIIGKIQEAYAEAQYAMEHCRALGDRYEEAATYRVAALSAAALGRNSEAKQLFEQGLALFEDIETPYEWGKLWLAYGDWLGSNPAEADGANVNAQDAYRAARDLFERMGARARLADAESRLARIGSATEPVAMLEPAAPRAASQLASRKSRSKELEQRSAWVLENFGVVTANIALIETLETVGKLARSKSPILVLGESGTGKELVAHAVHQLSGRRGEFLAINCAALPRDVVESELFGHVAGAFTGATRDKLGLLEACDGGTALLDEIGEMSPDLQSRLLRFLESGEIRKVGATRVTRVNTRIVAATNRDNAWLRGGQGFRADLYYRLAHAVIQLPPLRLRGGLDIELLATHFLEVACTEEHKQVELSAAAVSKLTSYGWPGNVRELKATISQRVVLAPDGHVVQAHEFRFDDGATPGSLDEEIEDVERKRIQEALRQTANSRADAARLLGIPRTTLINRIKRLGLE